MGDGPVFASQVLRKMAKAMAARTREHVPKCDYDEVKRAQADTAILQFSAPFPQEGEVL